MVEDATFKRNKWTSSVQLLECSKFDQPVTERDSPGFSTEGPTSQETPQPAQTRMIGPPFWARVLLGRLLPTAWGRRADGTSHGQLLLMRKEKGGPRQWCPISPSKLNNQIKSLEDKSVKWMGPSNHRRKHLEWGKMHTFQHHI